MICDEARMAVSAAADGELDDDALTRMEEHLADCPSCTAFEATIRHVRSELRFERLDDIPDLRMPDLPPLPDEVRTEVDADVAVEDEPEVADADADAEVEVEVEVDATSPVRSLRSARSLRTARPGRPLWLVAAAAAVIGLIAGAGFAGLGNEATPPASADLSDLILKAQRDIRRVDADFALTEFGGAGGQRRSQGNLLYEAPESLRLTIDEATTAETPGAVSPGDVDLVVEDGTWTLDSVRTCDPTKCTASGVEQWRQQVDGREPFSDAAPVPLELVTAVDGFALAEEPISLDARTIAGRQALGVQVTAAQISGFLAGLSPARDLRATHPTDPVDIWFDRDHLVPLAVVVRAADTDERANWARVKGYSDEAGDELLSYEVEAITINGAALPPEATQELPTPPQVQVTSEGFQRGEPSFVPEPEPLAEGLRPHVAGMVSTPGGPTVGIRTWTDGRAWVKVRATEEWASQRLFGELGDATVAVDLDDAGTAYVDGDTGKVAIHTDQLDVVVSGSLQADDLRTIAASLGLVGQPIPDTWTGVATATLSDAAAATSDLLVPEGLDGFAEPGVRIGDDGLVVQVYTGPGDRWFSLTQTDASELSPPAGKMLGVEVRGELGGYSFASGELEWSEDGSTFSLSSSTLSLGELVTIAESLAPR